MRYVVLWAGGIVSFLLLRNFSPAIALLVFLVVVTSPVLKLSIEIARTEDNKVKAENRRNYGNILPGR